MRAVKPITVNNPAKIMPTVPKFVNQGWGKIP
jgi:hypothetical protein